MCVGRAHILHSLRFAWTWARRPVPTLAFLLYFFFFIFFFLFFFILFFVVPTLRERLGLNVSRLGETRTGRSTLDILSL